MEKLMLLARSNLRKNKGQVTALFLLILIATLLLNLGILTYFNFGKFFDEKAEELHSPHAAIAVSNLLYKDHYEDYFKNYPGVTETGKEQVLFFPTAKFKYRNGDFSLTVIAKNAGQPAMSRLEFVEKLDNLDDQTIFVPYLLKTGGGYKLGDPFILTVGEQNYQFKIGGFVEDILLGSINIGGIGLYLPDQAYQKFGAQLSDPAVQGTMLSARLKNPADAESFIQDFQKHEVDPSSGGAYSTSAWEQNLEGVKLVRTITANIGAMIVVAFALVVVLVCLLVIKFRVGNSIEEDMQNIGALRATGYTGRQIMASYGLQFSLLALAAGIPGIALSYAAAVPTSAMLAAQTGLKWAQGFDPLISLVSLLLIWLIIAAAAFSSARRIRSLPPITALRGGITTHSFRKSPFPLDKGHGSPIYSLAGKNLFNNLKQNMMLTIILGAISFIAVFALVMVYNISWHNQAFVNLVWTEPCQGIVTLKEDQNGQEYLEKIKAMDHVRKVIFYDYAGVTADDISTVAYMTTDYGDLENGKIYAGRYPKHYNEVSIGINLAKKLNKGSGDLVSLSSGAVTHDYLITGLAQGANNMGREINLTYEGLNQILPGYHQNTLYVYLNNEGDISSFIQDVTRQYGQGIIQTLDNHKLMDSSLGVYTDIVSGIVTVIMAVTLLIAVLILSLVITASIIRRKQEFGIQKAIGYTTFQLMQQIALSFLPLVLCGAVLGVVVGLFCINPLLSLLFSSIGLNKVDFVITPSLVIGVCVFLGILAYGVALLVARQVRKISPFSLMAD